MADDLRTQLRELHAPCYGLTCGECGYEYDGGDVKSTAWPCGTAELVYTAAEISVYRLMHEDVREARAAATEAQYRAVEGEFVPPQWLVNAWRPRG